MEPISTALTGLALARSGIAFIKENMNSVQDAAQIGQQLASVFQGFDEFNKERYGQKTGFKDVASEMIEYKNLQNDLYNLKIQINMTYGHGFYESIVAERKKRIEEREERIRQERIRRRKEMEEVQSILLKMFVVVGLAATAALMFISSLYV
ncbi:hypothetical protein [uncultured Mediterranean phage uvMED]|nr:hypothetical protein [uncultured Mediterranean phage uvMED]|tara:strand:- start:769 stop:1224 length:456 start_codon:yes stop_codon:yes gene_type:complete